MNQFPKSISFREVADWNNLVLIDFETVSAVYKQVYKRAPQICCSHKREPFLKQLKEQPVVLNQLIAEYERVIKIHNKYTINFDTETKFINGIGAVNRTFITEEQIAKLISLYGTKYVTRKQNRKSKRSKSSESTITD